MTFSLLPSEALLAQNDGVRATLAMSPPTLRGTMAIPLIQELSVLVTSARVIVRGELFLGLFDADFSAWYLPPDGKGLDTLEYAELNDKPDGEPTLDLHTRRSGAHRLRAETLVLRLWGPNLRQILAALPASVTTRSAS